MGTRRGAIDRVLDVRAFDGGLGSSGLRTISALAEVTGIGRSRLCLIRGGYVPTDKLQERIARALGVGVGDLWKPIGTGGATATVGEGGG